MPDGGERRVGTFEWLGRHPAFTFGFRNFLADLSWLQAVQIGGARRISASEYDRLSRWVNIVVDLDRRFLVPYYFGGLVLAESNDHVQDALGILLRGKEQFPDEWRFPFYIGYLRYFVQGDPVAGGEAMAEASRLPGAPVYLPRLAARMLSEGRAPETALSFLSMMISEEADAERKRALERRYVEVVVERDLQRLEDAVSEYRSRFGSPPDALSDLVHEGILGSLPRDPGGGTYRMARDGSVYNTRMQERLRTRKR
jgi:hypothetical protein